MRVQIPVYTDRWMMGDRYGEVIGFARGRINGSAIARIKLDFSGRTIKVLIDDCKVVEE